MRSKIILAAISFSTIFTSACEKQGTPVVSIQQPPSYAVDFSPKGGCTEAIIAEIGKAKSQVLVLAYEFTSDGIGAAVIAAHTRGVQTVCVLDNQAAQAKSSLAKKLAEAGIQVVLDSKHSIMHNKVILIDGETVITGSFNFTNNAELHNAENLLIIHNNRDLWKEYDKNFASHWDHSIELKVEHVAP